MRRFRAGFLALALVVGFAFWPMGDDDVTSEPLSRTAFDDLLATGGTAAATAELVAKQGAKVAAFAFVVELSFLEGRKKLGDVPVFSLLTYGADE